MENDFSWLTKSPSISSLIKKHNWEKTSLGPVKNWPQSLKTAINMCLESRYPMYIWWGPDLVNIYNDAYIPIPGLKKHEKAFGRPAIEMWPENWNGIKEVVKKVYDLEESTSYENFKTQIERYGKLEDVYFDYSFNLLKDDEGKKRGIYSIAFEKTPHPLQSSHTNPYKTMSDFFSQAPAPMCILLGENHVYGLANPLYEELFGKNILGKSVSEVFDKEKVAPYVEILNKVFKTQMPYSESEVLVTLKDEKGNERERWLDVLFHPFLNEQGQSKGILIVSMDISDKILLKKKLLNAQKEIEELRAKLP